MHNPLKESAASWPNVSLKTSFGALKQIQWSPKVKENNRYKDQCSLSASQGGNGVCRRSTAWASVADAFVLRGPQGCRLRGAGLSWIPLSGSARKELRAACSLQLAARMGSGCGAGGTAPPHPSVPAPSRPLAAPGVGSGSGKSPPAGGGCPHPEAPLTLIFVPSLSRSRSGKSSTCRERRDAVGCRPSPRRCGHPVPRPASRSPPWNPWSCEPRLPPTGHAGDSRYRSRGTPETWQGGIAPRTPEARPTRVGIFSRRLNAENGAEVAVEDGKSVRG